MGRYVPSLHDREPDNGQAMGWSGVGAQSSKGRGKAKLMEALEKERENYTFPATQG